jgi:signal transduction histidine kinase
MIHGARVARYAVALISTGCAAGAGAVLHATLGYRFPLIAFYPAIMVTAWFGGLWPSLTATMVSALIVDRLWLAPLRAAELSVPGDLIALGLFVGIGMVISSFSESMHRSTARERAAREQAEQHERALQDSERQLRDALGREQAARAEAVIANRTKDRFLAIVSHELRTPLNAVLGWAEILRRQGPDPRLRDRAVEAIAVNAKRQVQLVDDLLDVIGMMSGKLQLQPAVVNINDVVRAVIELMQPAADSKRIELAFHDLLPRATVHGDSMRLQQILWNLISNAIKFTPDHGLVQIHTRELPNAIEIRVVDTGRGIPSEHLQAIFEPFHQVDGSITRDQSGLGLGLPIVKHLAEAHGGHVRAESAGPGKGSIFTLTLPLIPVSAPAITHDEVVAARLT